MSKTVSTVLTGKEVKELIGKAIGGFYLSKNHSEYVVTDFFNNCTVSDDSIQFAVEDPITLRIPISDSESYTNYAIAGENDDEEWDGSTYFDYHIEVSGYALCFNTTDKGNELTWEQFKELTNDNYVNFEIRSVNAGSLYINVNNCTIDVTEHEIEINSHGVNTIFDKSIIDAVYNDSVESEDVCYRFEFNNGMPDMCIEPEYRTRIFH